MPTAKILFSDVAIVSTTVVSHGEPSHQSSIRRDLPSIPFFADCSLSNDTSGDTARLGPLVQLGGPAWQPVRFVQCFGTLDSG